MNEKIREILGWYGSENPGTLTNMARILNHGTLGGTGRVVILPVDQGFEHGPARSFAKNPPSYDPRYHFELALEAGCNAYAAPLGFLEAAARDFAGELPLILKVNNNECMKKEDAPLPSVNSAVDDALRLGCCAIGFTVYPGSNASKTMYEEIAALTAEAKAAGLAVIIWSYPRGANLTKKGETAVDIVAYAAQVAAQLGANMIKVKPPSDHLEIEAAKKVYQEEKIPIGTLRERVQHVVQSAFNGRRIVIFSGGAAKGDQAVLEAIREIKEGGGFGSIIGRNSFQRSRRDGVKLLREVMEIYAD
jgi:class I fructose-bisphosphate aldolase